MILFTGRGWVIPVVGFGLLIAIEFTVEALTGDDAYYQDHLWPLGTGMLVMAVVTWVLVDRATPRPRTPAPNTSATPPLAQPAPGPVRRPGLRHRIRRAARRLRVRKFRGGSFVFLPLPWWRPILAGGGAAIVVADLVR